MICIDRIELRKVRNLPELVIPLDEKEKKHLILTGPNGSGKTTVVNELKQYLDGLTRVPAEKELNKKSAAVISFTDLLGLYPKWLRGDFVICSFDAHRKVSFKEPEGPKKIKEPKTLLENVGQYFVQYMVNLRARRSFANDDGDKETADKIQRWFDGFERSLAILLGHSDFELMFDSKEFNYTIKEKDKEPYHFSQLSDGYSALLSIVSELMLRMSLEEPLDAYGKEGVVLIDEVENHLHVGLQKKVMPFLTELFPNVQFIVTTHSPFVLSSIKDSVIFDLESRKRYADFSEYSYQSIIEGYYGVDIYSTVVVEAVDKAEKMLRQPSLTEEEEVEIKNLYRSVMSLPEERVKSVAPELRVKLKDLVIKNSSKLHGLL
ncbi:MAG: AAA family ATPase [Prevotellaceae bacterium]|nr:AAA family ATPase [Prevotellaceae bacterium]